MLGAILAGGLNTRYPSPKAFIEVGGERIIDRAIKTLGPLTSGLVISTNSPELYFPLGLPMIGDAVHGKGPLSGIVSILGYARFIGEGAVFVVACDMPYLSGALIGHMIYNNAREATAPMFEGKAEPLLAVYAASALPKLEAALLEGRTSMRRALAGLDAAYIDEATVRRIDPEGRSFVNVNTPEDYALGVKEDG